MTDYQLGTTVLLDRPMPPEQAAALGKDWALHADLDQPATAVGVDMPFVHLTGVLYARPDPRARITEGVRDAVIHLGALLGARGYTVKEWRSIEVLSTDEYAQRAATPAMPAVVNAEELGALAGLSRQRIHQYESDRRAGKRADFPTPVLDGYWLKSAAEHWARTRRTRPGPKPRDSH